MVLSPKSLIALCCLFMISVSLAQETGKIISAEEADNQFGLVVKYVSVPKSLLEAALKKTGEVLMLKITDKGLVMLDSKRNVLFPKDSEIKDEEVFTVFSTSVLNKLLTRGDGNDLVIEQRAEVLSITFDLFTLEFGNPCPPYCN